MKILFVNPFGIGDVLFTTPLVRSLKDRGDSIYYWCNERVADILRYNNAVADIYPISRGDMKKIFKFSPVEAVKRSLALINRIRKEKFDIALDFSLDYRYSLLLKLLGVRKIVGFDYKGRGRFLTDKIKLKGFNSTHMVEYYLSLVKFIDKEIKAGERMELFVGDSDSKWADGVLSRNGAALGDLLIGIAPGGGTSWGEDAFRKHWPKEKFAFVGNEIMKEKKPRIILFGSIEEKPICDFIGSSIGKGVINLCGETTLGQFAALLKRCKLLIANDGGPLHMASALGVKTVSLFGPVDERVYGPYPFTSEHTAIKSDIECRPCYKDFRYKNCGDLKCLDAIEPLEVLEAVRSKLE